MHTVRTVLGLLVLVGAVVLVSLGHSEPAFAQKKKPKKLDPEIQTALKALRNAKAALGRAVTDEVVGESGGKIEKKVVNQLEIAIEHVNKAIAATERAQKLDKNP